MDTLKEERWQRDKQLVLSSAAKKGRECQVLVADGNDSDAGEPCETFLSGRRRPNCRAAQRTIAASIVESAHSRRAGD